MKISIPFLSWTAKAAVEIEIPDDTEERFHLKVALELGVKARQNFDGASLVRARLDGASLDGASLVRARLDSIRADFYDVLLRAIPEVPGLLAALRAGRIDGSSYVGDCACLVGTIANTKGIDFERLPDLKPDNSRPAERWFLGINEGDTPETNQIARITEGWIVDFLRFVGHPDVPPTAAGEIAAAE